MPRWDDPRGPRHDHERDRWRRDQVRERGGPASERRTFGEEGRGQGREPWRAERQGARYDQDRVGYGWREGDAANRAYERHRGEREGDSRLTHRGEPYAYGGQEYGLEGRSPGPASNPGWGFDNDGERRRNFDFDDVGSGQSPAGYAYHRQEAPHPDQEFDPDYLRWREEQLRAHDRDYQDWRREQHRQYDEEYRQFRSERQRNFGRAFHDWRSQRSAVGGIADTTAAPGVSGYGDKSALGGGSHAADAGRPSGMLDSPGHLSSDPAMSQRGGHGGQGQTQGQSQPQAGGDRSPEFGKEPPQVQAASQGEVQGHARKAEERKKGDDRT